MEFKLPDLGEGIDSADISRILVSEGDQIESDQIVMELETEKAVADLPCPHSGTVAKIHVSVGDTVKVGQVLLTVEHAAAKSELTETPESPTDVEAELQDGVEDESSGDVTSANAKTNEVQSSRDQPAQSDDDTAASIPSSDARDEDASDETDHSSLAPSSEGRATSHRQGNGAPIPAGPATRRLARELDVDLASLRYPDGGRIRQQDVVQAYVSRMISSPPGQKQLPDFSRWGDVERVPVSNITRASSKRLLASWRTVPHVTQHGLADVQDLEVARRQHASGRGDAPVKITLTAIVIKAVVGILKESPKFNASFDPDSDELIQKHHFHIGVAVDTDRGLVVPVIRDADRKNLLTIAGDVAHLATKARDGLLKQDDLEGGTFTISNQGGIGGRWFTPIVNWPEVAILGIGRAFQQVEMRDGKPEYRLKLPLSLSYDHRPINGADAARFMQMLEDSLSGTFELLVSS